MLSLFISTLEMMGLTFVIGFFVAAVIKGIAFWADSLEYHHSHTAELAQFNKINKVRVKIGELLGLVPPKGQSNSTTNAKTSPEVKIPT